MGSHINIPQEGEMLGRFKLLRQVGRGGVGMVFHAMDTQLHIDVALKVLCLPDTDQTVISRFKHEVLLARRVSHPGICRIFDLHYENNIFFITMEFCSGLILERLIQQVGVLSPWHTKEIVASVCKAMNAAHAQGVIHRDLKPGNIVVKPNYQVSILDFGFSTGSDITSVTKAGAAVGTVHYVAPEVLNHIKPTAAVDIYSVGVIMYRCLTGYLPFGGDNVFAIMDAIRMGAVIPPRSVNPHLSRKIEKVILKAMALNPNDRYRSFRDLRKDLEEACGPKPKDYSVVDPINNLIEESVAKTTPNPQEIHDPDSSSHFDLMPEPMYEIPSYVGEDPIGRQNDLTKVAISVLCGVVILALLAIGLLFTNKSHMFNGFNLGKQTKLQIAPIYDVEQVSQAMIDKGLLAGDIPTVDNLLEAAQKANGSEQQQYLSSAIAIINTYKIDKPFIEHKIVNIQNYITNIKDKEKHDSAVTIWEQAVELFKANQYEKANKILNTIAQ